MTLPVSTSVAHASLDAAVIVVVTRYPGSTRKDIEDDRTVADILSRVNAKSARSWLSRSIARVRDAGHIERRKGRVGLYPVERAA